MKTGIELEELQQRAYRSVMERLSEANTASISTRIGELQNLHIAAFMDIENTTESLNHILIYKKEVAKRMLQCSDEKLCEQYSELIKQADNMIKAVLGM